MNAVPNSDHKPFMWWALQYARAGWAVHPLKPEEKTPLLVQWQNKASNDPARVREMWSQFPRANIGVHCGKSGLAVVDVDPRNGGTATLARLEGQHGPLWELECFEARTAGGGRHFVFRALDGPSLPAKLGDGVDLLHGNHYFVAAPSIGPSGGIYKWAKGQGPFDSADPIALPQLPAWAHAPQRGEVARRADADPGDPIDALAMIDPTVPDTSAERGRVGAALHCIDPDCDRATYLHIGMALCSTGWDDWGDVWRGWACGDLHERNAAKFDGHHFESDVRGMKVDGGVTMGTLYQLAKERGFDTARVVKPSQQETYGDISNAQRFATKYRGEFLHVHAAKKWLRWTGQHWNTCNNGEETKAAQVIAGEALDAAHAALREDPTERTKGNYSAALGVHRNARRLEAMLKLAAAEPGMSVASPADLDVDPYLLGVRNGVLNLKTGTRLVAKPDMLITRQAGAAFDPHAECPKWVEFLGQVFSDDADLIAFIQRAVGYSLTGSVDEEVMFFLLGNGANGKSVFANILLAIFGDYAVTVRSKMLARDSKGNSSDAEREKGRLPGARLVLINEVGQNDAFDDQQVKEIVSRERIPARMLYGESFDFMPTHAIWMRGNHQPIIRDAGDGMWRRIQLIRFERQFAESERKPNLEHNILSFEREGILAWAARGCLEWQRSGLSVPAAVRQAGDEYRRDSDVMGEWIDAHCIRNPTAGTPTSQLYQSYCSYLHAPGMQPPTAPSFGRQLSGRGFKRQRTNRVRSIQGLVLREWVYDGESL